MAVDKPDTTRVWASAAPPTDIEDPDISSPGKVEDGYRDEIPVYQHHNWIFNEASKSAKYLNEQGIGIWDAITTFPVGSIVKGSDLNLYQAIVEQSNNDPVGDKVNWRPFVTSTTAGGRKNLLDNGEFRIWQEGTSFSLQDGVVQYTADAHVCVCFDGITNVSRVAGSQFPTFSDAIEYGFRVQPLAGTSNIIISNRKEADDSYSWVGKTLTYSAIINSNEAVTAKITYSTPDSKDSWGFPTIQDTVLVPLVIGDNKVEVNFNNVSSEAVKGFEVSVRFETFTAGSFDASIALTQLEVGTVATDFEYIPLADALARCQRYFETDANTVGSHTFFSGDVTSGSAYGAQVSFKNSKRVSPSIILTNIGSINFPSTSTSVIADSEGFHEGRVANGTGAGEYESSWIADARL